jgi:hypothetical protein
MSGYHHDDRDHEDVDKPPTVYELMRRRAQSVLRMIAIILSTLSL